MTKILFVLTSHDTLGHTGRSTGWYLPEIAYPHAVFQVAGYEMEAVSPQGGAPAMDGVDQSDPVQRAFLDDPMAMSMVSHTLAPAAVDPSDYDAIFYVGGHGTMWDFAADEALAHVAAAIYEQGGVVAAVCHGPAGIVNVRLSDGHYLVAGKEVAAFTDEEEEAVGLTDVVPFLLESTLVARGARHTKAPLFQPHVVADRRLVTGQNPASAAGVADQVVSELANVVRSTA